MLYLTLRQLEYIVAVAEHRSVSAAAEAMNVSQPSLSVALAEVEARIGGKLFVRGRGSPVRPTPQAAAFLAEARDIVTRAARLADPDAFTSAVPEVVTLGCFQDLAPTWLASMMKIARMAYPSVTIRPVVGDFRRLERGMSNGEIDLALTYDLGLDAAFERTALGSARPHAFCSADHPIGVRSKVTLKRLAREPLILFDEGLSAQHVMTLFKQAGVVPLVNHRVASLEVMRSLSAHGEGVGVSYTAPPTGIAYDGAEVRSVPISDSAAREAIVLARRSDIAPTQALAGIVAALTENLFRVGRSNSATESPIAGNRFTP